MSQPLRGSGRPPPSKQERRETKKAQIRADKKARILASKVEGAHQPTHRFHEEAPDHILASEEEEPRPRVETVPHSLEVSPPHTTSDSDEAPEEPMFHNYGEKFVVSVAEKEDIENDVLQSTLEEKLNNLQKAKTVMQSMIPEKKRLKDPNDLFAITELLIEDKERKEKAAILEKQRQELVKRETEELEKKRKKEKNYLKKIKKQNRRKEKVESFSSQVEEHEKANSVSQTTGLSTPPIFLKESDEFSSSCSNFNAQEGKIMNGILSVTREQQTNILKKMNEDIPVDQLAGLTMLADQALLERKVFQRTRRLEPTVRETKDAKNEMKNCEYLQIFNYVSSASNSHNEKINKKKKTEANKFQEGRLIHQKGEYCDKKVNLEEAQGMVQQKETKMKTAEAKKFEEDKKKDETKKKADEVRKKAEEKTKKGEKAKLKAQCKEADKVMAKKMREEQERAKKEKANKDQYEERMESKQDKVDEIKKIKERNADKETLNKQSLVKRREEVQNPEAKRKNEMDQTKAGQENVKGKAEKKKEIVKTSMMKTVESKKTEEILKNTKENSRKVEDNNKKVETDSTVAWSQWWPTETKPWEKWFSSEWEKIALMRDNLIVRVAELSDSREDKLEAFKKFLQFPEENLFFTLLPKETEIVHPQEAVKFMKIFNKRSEENFTAFHSLCCEYILVGEKRTVCAKVAHAICRNLASACKHLPKEKVQALLSQATFDEGRTGLHFAAIAGSACVLRTLAPFVKNVLLHRRDVYGLTAFDYAVKRNSIEMVKEMELMGSPMEMQLPLSVKAFLKDTAWNIEHIEYLEEWGKRRTLSMSTWLGEGIGDILKLVKNVSNPYHVRYEPGQKIRLQVSLVEEVLEKLKTDREKREEGIPHQVVILGVSPFTYAVEGNKIDAIQIRIRKAVKGAPDLTCLKDVKLFGGKVATQNQLPLFNNKGGLLYYLLPLTAPGDSPFLELTMSDIPIQTGASQTFLALQFWLGTYISGEELKNRETIKASPSISTAPTAPTTVQAISVASPVIPQPSTPTETPQTVAVDPRTLFSYPPPGTMMFHPIAQGLPPHSIQMPINGQYFSPQSFTQVPPPQYLSPNQYFSQHQYMYQFPPQ